MSQVPASMNQAEPGSANNAIHQINDSGLSSINSYGNFLPVGGDGLPSTSIGGRTWGQGLSATTSVGSEVVPEGQNNTRRVRGARVEPGEAEQNITDIAPHTAFQDSPYYFYVQKPGSEAGQVFTPYIQPVQTQKLGRAIPLQSIRYNDYHLKIEKPAESWRMGLVGPDVATVPAEKDINRLSHPQINAFGLETSF
jgi:hypothetical protein